MSLFQFFKKTHRILSMIIAIPLLITIFTGILLSTRTLNTLLQPETPTFQTTAPFLTVSWEQILLTAKKIPELEVNSWADVNQIDVRPEKSLIRIRSKHNQYEVMINGLTGEVVSIHKRYVTLITSIHQGAYFGKWIQYGIFMPLGFLLLYLLISGIYLFVWPQLSKRKKYV